MNLTDQYDAWHRLASVEANDTEALVHPWHQTAARLLPPLDGLRVLEVGCGRGDFTLWMSRMYPTAHITGMDFSDAAIEIATERSAGHTGTTFVVGDAQAMPFEDASFDVVVSCECLEHIPVPGRMTAEIGRVLAPGGRLVLTTENYFNGMVLAWIVSWIRKTPFDSGSGAQPHENFFLFWNVRRMIERGGLAVDRTESNWFQWLLLPRTDPAALCTRDFSHPLPKRLFRPFGRHFTFCAHKLQRSS